MSRGMRHTLVAPKKSLPDGRLPPAPPRSVAPVAGGGSSTATSEQSRRQAAQVSTVAPARNRRLIATPHGFVFGVTAERTRGRRAGRSPDCSLYLLRRRRGPRAARPTRFSGGGGGVAAECAFTG